MPTRENRCTVEKPTGKNKTYGVRKSVYDDLGQRKQSLRRGYATEDDALQECITWRKGLSIDPSQITMAQLLTRWLEEEVLHSLRPNTIAQYSLTLRKHLIPRIGHLQAQKLTPNHVNALKGKMQAEDVGCRSIELALLRLSQALTWAAQIELVGRNVAERVEKPKCVPEEGIALTHAQARAFLAAAEEATYSPLWLLYLSTGLRRGEGLGLTWRDVDLQMGKLTVRKQVVVVKDDGVQNRARPRITEVKSKASRRTIDLDARLVLALEDQAERQLQLRKSVALFVDYDLIFCTQQGLPLNPNNVLRTFHEIASSSGMPDKLCLHDLRHSHATHMVLAGVPILEVSRRLGHSKPSITYDKYQHLTPGYVGSATAAVTMALHE